MISCICVNERMENMLRFTSAMEESIKKGGEINSLSGCDSKHRYDDRRTRKLVRLFKSYPVTTDSDVQHLASRPKFQGFSAVGKMISIFRAAEGGDLQTVRSLIHQTRPEIRKAKSRCTLLHVAAANNHMHIVKFLLKYISPNVINKNKQTPAHLAAMEGCTDILRVLLTDLRINTDMRDVWQRTYKDWLAGSLFEAVMASDEHQTKELLELGANPDCHAGSSLVYFPEEDLNVTTARQLAFFLGEKPIVDMFLEPDNCENFRCMGEE
ncbi:ankyrin repeat family A protein 2-like isoform X2 [Macrobrachium rosenbergii]|uniref:ankyrin repeat family A protein 2-like isoform X2 n=1 Tax=Macrobrachium rosenbergii TaxID=79674 RepID=UPI0034D70CE7